MYFIPLLFFEYSNQCQAIVSKQMNLGEQFADLMYIMWPCLSTDHCIEQCNSITINIDGH